MATDITKSKVYQTLPTIKSSDADWIKWADLVISKYGANLGKQVFLTAWTKRGSQNANTIAFRKHIKDNYNLEIDESIWNKIADLGGGFADSVGKVFKVGKIVVIGAAAIAVVVVLGVGYQIIKNPASFLPYKRG